MAISDQYHIHYEEKRLWEGTRWLGVNIQKNPCDMVIMQELIFKIKPSLIIETGTSSGGSALFFASILELIGNGQVISVDKNLEKVSFDYVDSLMCGKRITFLTGESIDPHIISSIEKYIDGPVIVFLDSWHSEEYVAKELEIYSKFVTVDSYIVVEDTHIGNPIKWKYKDLGPKAAVDSFLANNSKFVIDHECEKLLFTFNPSGYLKRIY